MAHAAMMLMLVAVAGGEAMAASRSLRAAPTGASAPVASAVKAAAFTVAVLGDAFGEALAEGLRDGLATDPAFALLTDTHAPYGLSDDSRFAWAPAVRSLLATRSLDAVVVMLGTDDRRPLPDGSGIVEPGSPPWRTLYANRVAALVAAIRTRPVPFVWVGLPIVADDQTAAFYAELNGIAREQIAAAGGTYVDSWDAFADDGGRFDAAGPDRAGRITRLRAADGRGFTHAGAIKLASFVEPALRRAQAASIAAAAEAKVVSLPAEPEVERDIDGEIRRELGLPALAEPAPLTDAPAPAMILTEPPLSPDGSLAAASIGPAPLAGTAGSAAQRALVEGRPIPPKPGRIDDFAWPRP